MLAKQQKGNLGCCLGKMLSLGKLVPARIWRKMVLMKKKQHLITFFFFFTPKKTYKSGFQDSEVWSSLFSSAFEVSFRKVRYCNIKCVQYQKHSQSWLFATIIVANCTADTNLKPLWTSLYLSITDQCQVNHECNILLNIGKIGKSGPFSIEN